MLDCYTFKGRLEYMTFEGPKEEDFGFTIVISPEADERLVEKAAMALSEFLVDSANMGSGNVN